MPWPAIVLILGLLALTIGTAVALWGQTAIAAVPGAVAGVFGALLAPRRTVPWPLIAALAGAGLLTLSPSPLVLFGMLLALSAIAGAEATLTGGRAGVMALFMVIGLHLIPAMPSPAQAAPPAIFSLVVTWGLAQLTPLAGAGAQNPAPRRFGIGLALFLATGLSIATFAMRFVDESFAHWLALLFVMRGLAPPGEVIRNALRFGLGATLGSGLALIALVLALPKGLMLGLAFVAVLAGFRLAPASGPWSPAAFSAAILFLTAPSPHDAVFRIEAAVFAVVLSTVLTTFFATLWVALDRSRQKRQPGQAGNCTSSGS